MRRRWLNSFGSQLVLRLIFMCMGVLHGMPAIAAEWHALADQDLRIPAGSILDLSSLIESGPAGKHGRAVATADGHIAFAHSPSAKQRFMCASQPYGVEEGFPDHDAADLYASQLRIHGYNLARFHFVENVLMHGRNRDFDFNTEQLDRFHYFLAALKREGIYWMMDALTSWNGAYGDVGPDRWVDARNVKLGVYFDSADQQHWRNMVDRILALKNPYTGMSPLHDPALLAVVTVNEGGLNPLLNQRASPPLNLAFGHWLSRQYGSVNAAMKKWGDNTTQESALSLPRQEWHASPRMADAQRFYFDLQSNTYKWMAAHLRSQGYQGMITGFDNWFTAQDAATRAQLEFVTAHSYHDEASNFVSRGSRIKQVSSLSDRLAYIRDLAGARYWNKPFAVTEFDQPFWNRYRYESGLAMGAYAAFQDWDLVCRHASGPIELEYGNRRGTRHQYLFPYTAGLDPVARASETLTSLLFLRGDVRPSLARIALQLDQDYVFARQAGIGLLPDDLETLGLVTGLGIQWGEKKFKAKEVKLDSVMMIDDAALRGMTRVLRKLGSALFKDALGSGQAQIDALKDQGLLAKTNASNISHTGEARLESDTREIILNSDQRSLSVISSKTEAFAFDTIPPTGSHFLRIIEASSGGVLAASAMDGGVLKSSSRILLILASDARNSGMEFEDADAKVLKKLGGKPVLLKSSRIRFEVLHATPEKMRLFALTLNGKRDAELPLKKLADRLEIVLDTSVLPNGPTTFFELSSAVSEKYKNQLACAAASDAVVLLMKCRLA